MKLRKELCEASDIKFEVFKSFNNLHEELKECLNVENRASLLDVAFENIKLVILDVHLEFLKHPQGD